MSPIHYFHEACTGTGNNVSVRHPSSLAPLRFCGEIADPCLLYLPVWILGAVGDRDMHDITLATANRR